MICAMTARRISDGRVDEFIEKFGEKPQKMPDEIVEKFKAVYACRQADDPNVVLTFGLFDGTIEELRALEHRDERTQQLDMIDPLVEDVLIDGSFEVVREFISEMSPAQ
ncbi:MAG: hypothetical protein ACPGYP_00045 [Solirubrobacterales bacterium]